MCNCSFVVLALLSHFFLNYFLDFFNVVYLILYPNAAILYCFCDFGSGRRISFRINEVYLIWKMIFLYKLKEVI